MSQKQPTLLSWLQPVDKPPPAPVEETRTSKKRPCSKRLRESFLEHLAGGPQRVAASRDILFDRFEQVTTRSLALTQWAVSEADTATGLELRGVSSVEFDKQGELFVASSGNRVHLYNAEDEFLSAYWGSSPEALLVLSTREYIRRMRWNHADMDVIGCLGVSPQLRLYNLALTSTSPIEVFSDRADMRTPLCDFVMDSGSGKTVAAVGRNGKAVIWDRRAQQNQPRCVLSGPRSAQDFVSATFSPDGHVLYAGGRNGRVACWDLRATRQTSFGAPTAMTAPLLHLFSLEELIASFESTAAPGCKPPPCEGLPQTSVQHLALDPKDPSRLAFQLGAASRTPPLVGCGWLGVLDVNELSVTHLHCPEPATDGMLPRSGVRRTPAWMPAWGVVVTASDFAADVAFIDVTSRRGRWAGAGQQAEHIPQSCRISSPGVAVACHPHSDHIVVGTEDESVIVLSPWPRPSPEDDEDDSRKVPKVTGEEGGADEAGEGR